MPDAGSDTLHRIFNSFRFKIELDGMQIAGFMEVGGLSAETEVEEYREGGVNAFVHRLPRQVTYPSIVLRKGMTFSSDLWDWYSTVIQQQFRPGSMRKNGAIVLEDGPNRELCRWNFRGAYPVKWSGPDLNASQSAVAIESIELAHQGLKMIVRA